MTQPIVTPHKPLDRRLFDWRFPAAFTAMLLVIWIVASGIVNQYNFNTSQDNLAYTRAHATARINGLLAAYEAQTQVNAENSKISQANQRLVVLYAASLDQRLGGLLAWLTAHGIKIPAQFLESTPPPQLTPSLSVPGTKPAKKAKAKKVTTP